MQRLRPRTLLAGSVLAVAGLVGLGGPASAHVIVSASTTAAGAYSVLTFSVPHGCAGSATTSISISIPEEIAAVTPTRNALWTVEKKTEELADPVTDEDGNTITERDAEVVYTALEPLPDGYRDAFELSLQLPDSEGTTLAFPVIQTCEEGETAWTEVPAADQDADAFKHPAPTITLTAATGGDGHGHDPGQDAAEPADEPADEPGSETDDDALIAWIALGVGVAGLVAGALAVIQARRR